MTVLDIYSRYQMTKLNIFKIILSDLVQKVQMRVDAARVPQIGTMKKL